MARRRVLFVLMALAGCASAGARAPVQDAGDDEPDAALVTPPVDAPWAAGGQGGNSAPDTAAPAVAADAGPDLAPAAPDATTTAIADPGKEGDGDFTVNGPYQPPPEATLAAGVTAGKMETVMVTTKIFPGHDRTVTVYSPAGYVAGTPAPFMVIQDGPSYINNFKLNVVLDNMIAKKQLPAMICIFVPNGGSNRSFEYDSLSDLYVKFVLEEVLPAVEAKLPIKLTTDPEGRAAGGHSSGGIAAFTMGWHRPDQFRRILTHSGSFVSIRGGDKVPGMVSMNPAKPLRVFLSVGSKDNENGRWQRGNEALAKSLAAQQYHYRFVLLNGGTHAQSYPASLLPETLLWLWRGYPIAGN
jgi:enterochelin esterase-like enzyme